MTDEQINVAIAEACGWTDIHDDPMWGWLGNPPDLQGSKWPILRYTECLNAMHEVEESLFTDNQKLRWKYVSELHITAEPTRWGNYAGAHATAKQRAEAFLRTLGKWKEAE